MEGRISSIQRQSKNRARASIFLDDVFAFGVNDQTIEEFRLRKGDYLDPELYERILEFDFWIDAKRIAMRYIDARARSEKEVRDRLKREEIPEDVIQKTVEFLKSYELLNDERWARAYIADRLMRKQVSATQLQYELRQKGVAEVIAVDAVAELGQSESDYDRAKRAAEKKWAQIARSTAEEKRRLQKMITFLAARGFSFEISKAVATALVSNNDVEHD